MSTHNQSARRAWAFALQTHITRGKLFHVEIRHDDDCTIYTSGPCNCSPDRVLKDDKGRTLAEVTGAGSYSPLEFMGAAHDPA